MSLSRHFVFKRKVWKKKRVNGLKTNLSISGLEIATNTVPFGTKFFPFVTKIPG